MTQLVPGLQENAQDTSNLALPQDLQVSMTNTLLQSWTLCNGVVCVCGGCAGGVGCVGVQL